MKGNVKQIKQILVLESRSWSSSFSRAMRTAGRAASAAALRQAALAGTQVAYLKNGVIVKGNPDANELK